VRAKAIAMMMEMIKGDLAALNIRHDVFFSERSLTRTATDRRGATIGELRAKGDVYEGRLPPPKGAPVEDYEDREQTLFRATALWRRCRSSAEEVGWQLHLFRLRHRLSQDQVRSRLSST
jgi:arginyl-tRNA synthetase